MTDSDPNLSALPPSPAPRRRWVTVLLRLLGCILVLPGLWSIPYVFSVSTSGFLLLLSIPSMVYYGIPIVMFFALGVRLIVKPPR